uniref:Uncharacterized protein n=1 Tax=Tetranychus urticae TaxID=32264 RepID=T1K1E2_TETUR
MHFRLSFDYQIFGHSAMNNPYLICCSAFAGRPVQVSKNRPTVKSIVIKIDFPPVKRINLLNKCLTRRTQFLALFDSISF